MDFSTGCVSSRLSPDISGATDVNDSKGKRPIDLSVADAGERRLPAKRARRELPNSTFPD